MRYILVRWTHDFPDEPIELFSQLDEDSWEVRKVEVFPDGSMGYAEADDSTETTRLCEIPLPPLDEINGDPEFVAREITRDEFDQAWEAAHRIVQRT